MAATYEPIATTTLGSNQASVTFSSISGSYTDIICVVSGKNSASSARIDVQFNSDTASNYSYTRLQGDGSSATSNRASSTAYIIIGTLTTEQNTVIAQINNYANTTTYKTSISRWNASDGTVGASVGLWRSTSAINAIKFSAGADNLAAGMVISIYGIASA
jgi:GTP cyclohydrolase III